MSLRCVIIVKTLSLAGMITSHFYICTQVSLIITCLKTSWFVSLFCVFYCETILIIGDQLRCKCLFSCLKSMCQPRAVMAWMSASCSTTIEFLKGWILLHMDIILANLNNCHQFPYFLTRFYFVVLNKKYLSIGFLMESWISPGLFVYISLSLSLSFPTWFCIHSFVRSREFDTSTPPPHQLIWPLVVVAVVIVIYFVCNYDFKK